RTGASTSSVTVPFTNAGTLIVTGGTFQPTSTVTNYTAGTKTLTGGTWHVGPGSTLDTSGKDIRTLGRGAFVQLEGLGSNWSSVTGLTTINAGAGFALSGGRDFAASPLGGIFTNAGTLSVGSASDFDVTGSLVTTNGALSIVLGSMLDTPIASTGPATLG